MKKRLTLAHWHIYEVLWLSTFIVIACLLTFFWRDTLFGLTVFVTGVLCVVLTAKGSLWAFFFGFFNTVGYAYLAYGNGLYGEMGLNLFFFLPMNFIGYFLWKRHMATEHLVEMRDASKAGMLMIALLVLVCILIMGYLLSLIASQNTPYIDATTNVLSIFAYILTVKRYKEQWLIYIILNAFTILMWSIRLINGSSDAALMIVMWSAYLVNAFYGYYNWNKNSVTKDVK